MRYFLRKYLYLQLSAFSRWRVGSNERSGTAVTAGCQTCRLVAGHPARRAPAPLYR
jgi:hypothetical protein